MIPVHLAKHRKILSLSLSLPSAQSEASRAHRTATPTPPGRGSRSAPPSTIKPRHHLPFLAVLHSTPQYTSLFLPHRSKNQQSVGVGVGVGHGEVRGPVRGGGGGARRGGGGGRVLRPVRRDRRRPRAGERRREEPAGDAPAGPDLGLRLQLQGQVPVRRVQRPDEAHPRQLRRHRHFLLPVVRRERRRQPRRDRHRVHGQPLRRPRRHEHQRLGQRRRQEGAPVLPLVRPQRRLPHLQDHLEPQEHHIPGGQPAGEDVQEVQRPGVPEQQADAAARDAVGRQLLGDAARRRQDRLEQRALRGVLPGLHRQRLRQQRRLVGVPRRRERLDEPPARRRRPQDRRLGRALLHVLHLLHRRHSLPQGLPRRVLPQLIDHPQIDPQSPPPNQETILANRPIHRTGRSRLFCCSFLLFMIL